MEDQDWGHLPNGGKDGIFMVIITLRWWIHFQDLSDNSKLGDAMEDVTWVLKKLISVASAQAINPNPDSDSDSGSNSDTTARPNSSPTLKSRITQSSTLQQKRPRKYKIGSPKRQTKRVRI